MQRPSAAYLSLAVLVLQNSMLALTMGYSRTMGGDMYFASTAVVTCEVLKLLVSFFLLMKDEAGKSLPEIMRKKVFADPYDMMRLSVSDEANVVVYTTHKI